MDEGRCERNSRPTGAAVPRFGFSDNARNGRGDRDTSPQHADASAGTLDELLVPQARACIPRGVAAKGRVPLRNLSRAELTLVRHLVTGSKPPERSAPINWELVVTCAGYHRLGPLLHEGLKQSPIEAPSFVVTRLEKSFHVELAKAVIRLHHVETLEAASVRSGRPLCLLKGAAFAGSLYPNPASRPMADVDVLVQGPSSHFPGPSQSDKLSRLRGCRKP